MWVSSLVVRDTLYVEELIGPETVNTIPPATLDAFRDYGRVRASLEENIDRAGDVIDALSISASHSYRAESPVRTRGIPRASNSSITEVRSMTEPSPQIEATLCASMNQRALSMPREISVKMSEVS